MALAVRSPISCPRSLSCESKRASKNFRNVENTVSNGFSLQAQNVMETVGEHGHPLVEGAENGTIESKLDGKTPEPEHSKLATWLCFCDANQSFLQGAGSGFQGKIVPLHSRQRGM